MKNQEVFFKSNQIIHGSCEDLKEIPDNTISLTITSPPYWNAIDYDIHCKDSSKYYRTRKYAKGYQDYEDYLIWLTKIFSNIFTKTKPGGFACVIIGTVLYNKRHYPVPFDLVNRFTTELDFEFHQDIIWHKVTGGVKRAGVFIQKPYPGYFYPNIMTEYILIFRKQGPAIFDKKNPEIKNQCKMEINQLFTTEMANTVWHIAPVPPNCLDHPCPFPEEIPYRLIQLYSYPGDLVLDPFLGSGQTIKVAHHLKREYIGYETIKKYVDYSKQRLQEPLSLREKQLLAVFNKIPTPNKKPKPSIPI